MKKIYINGPYDVEIRDVPIPTPGPGEVLIKTQYTGISSGTEMMLYCGTFPNFKLKKWPQWTDYPVCPGYELVGTVVAIGEEAAVDGDMSQLDSLQPKSDVLITKASDFKVGDRVISMGEHAQYACLPAEFITKILDHVSSEEATLAVLGNTAMQAIRRGAIEFGDTVAVIGAGILGYLVAVEAKLAGAGRVIVIDKDNSRLEVAKESGADLVLNPDEVDIVQAVKDYNGILADVVFEATGARGTEQTALDLVRDRGRVVIVGWHTDCMNFQFGDFYFKEVTLMATRAGGPEAGLPYAYVRWTSDQMRNHAMDLIAKGKISGKFFKPSMFKPEEIVEVYDMIAKRDPRIGMQAMLKWD